MSRTKTPISPEDKRRVAELPPPPTFTYYRGDVPVEVCYPYPITRFLYNAKYPGNLGKPATDEYYYWMERSGIYFIIIRDNILWYIGKSRPVREGDGIAGRVWDHSCEQIGRAFIWLYDVSVSFHDMSDQDPGVISRKETELINNGPKPMGNYDNEDWQAKLPFRDDVVLPRFFTPAA